MSQATSPSTAQPYGLARVCRVWGVVPLHHLLATTRALCAWRPAGARWSLCG